MDILLENINKSINEKGSPEKILDLFFCNLSIGKISEQASKMLQSCKNLCFLVFENCQLQSLDNLPTLDLRGLDLSANKISDKDLINLLKYKNLKHLVLSENNICELKIFQILIELEKLRQLDLYGNPITDNSAYRSTAFQLFGKLNWLDGKNNENKQSNDDDSDTNLQKDQDSQSQYAQELQDQTYDINQQLATKHKLKRHKKRTKKTEKS